MQRAALCAAAVLFLLCISTQPFQAAGGFDFCGGGDTDDPHGWASAEDVTAQEQAEYLDKVLNPGLGPLPWGGFWAQHAQAKLPLYKYWNASQAHFDAALAGLLPQKKKRLLSDLGKQLDVAWQNMAAIHQLCGMVRKSRVDEEWEGGSEWSGPFRSACKAFWGNKRLTRAYALAQAYAGPSIHSSEEPLDLFMEMHHRDHLQAGVAPLEQVIEHRRVYGTRSSIKMLVMLLAQASEPSLRGKPYSTMLLYLGVFYNFLHDVVPDDYFDSGIPAWVDPQHAGQIPTTQHALVWVLQHSLAVLTLEAFHNHTTGPGGLRGCSNISKWYNDEMLFSPLGLSCVMATRYEPASLAGIAKQLGHLPVSEESVVYDQELVEQCQGWYECSSAFVKFCVLLLQHVVWPLTVLYVFFWRPDLLVFWTWYSPDVHVPSYAAYAKQVRHQRLLAKGARQAAAAEKQPRHSSSGGGSGASTPGSADAAGSSSGKVPEGSGEGVLAYVWHLFVHCWCPRVRYLVASYAGLMSLSSLFAPVRLAVGGLHSVGGFLAGVAQELWAGTAMACKRICC